MLFKICKNISVALIFCSISNIANAGINGTTAHSRANCVNNESITWWLGHSYNWRVVSIHNYKGNPQHNIDTGYAVTWRQAAVHWGEASPTQSSWSVSGHHFLSDYAGGKFPFESVIPPFLTGIKSRELSRQN